MVFAVQVAEDVLCHDIQNNLGIDSNVRDEEASKLFRNSRKA